MSVVVNPEEIDECGKIVTDAFEEAGRLDELEALYDFALTLSEPEKKYNDQELKTEIL